MSGAAPQFQWDRFPVAPIEALPTARPLYPFSVIPGGAVSPKELKAAIAHDPIVAEHYSGFDVAKAHKVKADKARLVFVSYRLGNEVFWTKRPLKISRGETLITDGKNEARTRCGNRLSATPAGPVSPKEPPPEALEANPTPEIFAVVNPPLDLPLTPPPPSTIQPPEHGRIYFPPIIPIWWGSGQPSVPVTPVTPVPPVQTPEPGSLVLLAAGASALWLARRKLLRRPRQN